MLSFFVLVKMMKIINHCHWNWSGKIYRTSCI